MRGYDRFAGALTGAFVAMLLAPSAGAPASAAMVELYVARDGNDVWSGRRPAPTVKKDDGPFATLEGARDAIRARKRAGKLPDSGVTVRIRGGLYPREKSFELTSQDSGTPAAPVVYRAYRDEPVRLAGGRAVGDFRPVTDEAVRARLDPAARDHVLQADLKGQGIGEFGSLRRRGFGLPVAPSGLEVFFQGRPMTLARWPNDAWTKIVAAPAGQTGGKLTYEGDRPRRWQDSDDLWIHGYWTWDWADSYERVASIDREKREITTVEPHGVYGYTPGKRFYFLNVLEELDQPGEYYLDRKSGILYFWPPAPARECDTVVSLLEAPLVTLKDVSHVTLRDLVFEATRGSAVTLSGGAHCRLAGCTFRNLGDLAASIEGGTEHEITGCDVYDTGEGALAVSGGDRKTLALCNHAVVNNDLTRFNRWSRTYHPGVLVSGVGIRIAGNHIHDAPHNAILMSGNDHLVEYNEIDHVCRETGDAGAIYMGRNLTMRGTRIRYNHFHDLRAGGLEGGKGFTEVMAVYLDDCFCGTEIYGNLFVRAGRAAMIGGGRDNTIENNVFIDCNPAIHVDARGKSWAKSWFNGQDPFLMDGLKEVPYDRPPYSVQYPQLPGILTDDPAQPKGNRIVRNIRSGGRWADLLDRLTPEQAGIGENFTEGDPGFVAPEKGDFRLKPDAPARKIGFQPIPFEKIGPRRDEYRRRLPADD